MIASVETQSFDDLPPASGVAESPDLKRGRRRRAASSEASRVDRLPPHAPEMEQGVIGCILLSPQDTLPIVISKFGTNDDIFYDLRHQTIYAHLCQMYDNRLPVDVMTVAQRLKDFELLDQIGGIPYINALQDAVPSAANISYYSDIVYEKYLLRRLLRTCTDSIGRVYEFEGDVEEIFDQTERDILSIRQNESQNNTLFRARDVVLESMQEIEALSQQTRVITGIPSGFADLDMMTTGFKNGEMIVIAARPSLGKTSLAMNIVDYAAVESKIPCGVFSLEMTKRSLVSRMIAARARVNLRELRYSSDRDYPRITNAAGRIAGSTIIFDDTPALSVMQIRARARMMVQMYGVKMFVIDYLQLCHATSRRANESRQNEVAEISGGIKALAKELNVPVIVLSQLNREIEKQKRQPNMSDLRESGAIEQDADVIGFLHATKIDDEATAYDAIPVDLLIRKQRNGPTGEVALTFLKSFTRFESAAKVSDEDLPDDSSNPTMI